MGTKTIRILENGEYGHSATGKTVVVKPIFKVFQSLKSHIARELSWHTIGRKVDSMFDAVTGVEVKSIDGIQEGSWYVVSNGNAMKPLPTGSKLFIQALQGKQEL